MIRRQSKGYAFVSVPKHVCDELLKLNKVKFYDSQIKIEEAKSTRRQTIVVSSTAKNQPVVVNNNLEERNSLQNLRQLQVNKIIVKLHNHIHLLTIR